MSYAWPASAAAAPIPVSDEVVRVAAAERPEAKIKRLAAEAAQLRLTCGQLLAEVESLRAQLEAVRVHAERYTLALVAAWHDYLDRPYDASALRDEGGGEADWLTVAEGLVLGAEPQPWRPAPGTGAREQVAAS